MAMPNLVRFLSLGLLILLAACSALTPYKLPIQQGNVVASESLTKLKSGMTKNQVVQVLGTPMVNDVFHANRWDYVHYLAKRGKMTEQNHVGLIFQEERLTQLIGAGVPALEPITTPDLPTDLEPKDAASPPEKK
jgi:outer membrane protein assembly factor BamE